MGELASNALEHFDLEVAKLAYGKLEDYNSLAQIKEFQVCFYLYDTFLTKQSITLHISITIHSFIF